MAEATLILTKLEGQWLLEAAGQVCQLAIDGLVCSRCALTVQRIARVVAASFERYPSLEAVCLHLLHSEMATVSGSIEVLIEAMLGAARRATHRRVEGSRELDTGQVRRANHLMVMFRYGLEAQLPGAVHA